MLVISLVITTIIIFFCIKKFIHYHSYKKSIYYFETRNNYTTVMNNKKLYREYLIVNKLSKLPGISKFVINAYTTTTTRKTTELDILFIHETGIYIVEYKDYSGWIYGNEDNKRWIQILENNQKNFFYNPLLKNQENIQILQKEIHNNNLNLFKSFIIFSDRCILKKLDIFSPNIIVLKQNKMSSYLEKHIKQSKKIFSPSEIYTLYQQLKPFTIISRLRKK